MTLEAFIPIGVSLIIAGFNCAMFIVIKFNDMKHLEVALNDLKGLMESVVKRTDVQGERISNLEGRCAVNHKQ